ncbi:unnamed protein product [Zymoseptoria tritici ST99CH_3D1]|uniref:Uncharacterized protein n=1 Tax=Zymoseptoria tritici (strain ST99CH_3D7) TaxID=1276538 RepID=A0A1X7S1S4_ZYMT9|nr:unnamed protein product [Zymoseptoria tritici ST99CH_3D7]SMR59824.1 unnamed protein product [Zymoseptoria tritici ST99CH_3D1]
MVAATRMVHASTQREESSAAQVLLSVALHSELSSSPCQRCPRIDQKSGSPNPRQHLRSRPRAFGEF